MDKGLVNTHYNQGIPMRFSVTKDHGLKRGLVSGFRLSFRFGKETEKHVLKQRKINYQGKMLNFKNKL